MYTWGIARGRDRFADVVDHYPTLDAILEDLTTTAWEDPSNEWLNYITDETGMIVAVAIFGPGKELLVTVSDGRRLEVPMPESYRAFFEARGER